MECPNGVEPVRSGFNEKNGTITIHMDKKDCNANCPFYALCHPAEQKKQNKKTISVKGVHRAQTAREITEEEYAEHYRYRNGVETIFFILQAYYGIQSMPVRGYEATAFKVGYKIGGVKPPRLIHRI